MFLYEKYETQPDYIPIGADTLISNIKNGYIKWYQFYGTQLSITENNWLRINDGQLKFIPSQGKKLNKTYYDIETYVKIDETLTPFNAKYAYYPVNATAVYNNISNTAKIVYTRIPELHKYSDEEITQLVIDTYLESCKNNNTYIVEDIKIEVISFESEEKLLVALFEIFREFGMHILMGFNSGQFDDPYIIKRLKKLRPMDWESIISEFGQVQSFGELSFEIPDYNLVDILELYKPVDAGGSGFGKSLPDFRLDTIAKKELGIKKLDLEEDFVYSYENNIVNYLTYNLFDTLITFKLDEKLKFLEQIFSLAEINSAPLGATIRGRSMMFSARNNKHYMDKGNVLRHGKFGAEVFYKVENS